jgi:soluble lytic murein transglycosylase-like protein
MRPAFMAAANATRLPVSLLVAVAKVESGMRQTARSPVGAVGLLQLMPETAEQYGLDPRRASENVLAGARYLAGLFDRYSAADTALAAYNAGPTAVDRAGQIAPDGQTLTYVANVDRAWSRLQGCR